MLYYISLLVIIFFCYSFVGYLLEVAKVSYGKHQLVLSRGYLIGPYLPIFGFGSILMIALLHKYQEDIIVLFILSLTVCCLLEYFTSLLMEKIFNLRWWDYSYKKFNINGRICLENGIMFGLGGVLLVRYLHPPLLSLLQSFHKNVTIYLGMFLLVIIFIDFCFSTYTILQLKNELRNLGEKDSTEQIRSAVKKSLKERKFFQKHFFRAFPDILKSKNLSRFKKQNTSTKEKTK